MRPKHILVTISIICFSVACLLLSGCSSDKGTSGNGDDVAKSLSTAWDHFEKAEYDEALIAFNNVIALAGNNPEALMGKGWCFAFNAEYDSSIINFYSADLHDLPTLDARMGLAAVYRDYPPDFGSAIANATAVIESDSNYVFSKRISINYKDAHLIKADCFFRRAEEGDFPAAHVEVNYLCRLEGLDPLPAPESLTGEEYEILLGQKLDSLTVLIGD